MEITEQFEKTWDNIDLPAIILPVDAKNRPAYQNTEARKLCGCYFSILEAMPGQDAKMLLDAAADKNETNSPLFCHIGDKIYSAVLMRWHSYKACIFQEVTDYYEDNKRALDEAIMASQAKTSFLSEMSHDIRTPMGAIIGLTNIALGQKDAPPKIKECLEKIKVASGHMMSLLNEVLDMSRIESGKILIQPEEVNIADLLHEILIVAKPQADTGKVEFELEMGNIEQERLLLDSVRLKQICLNLLSNAIKFTPAGGKVKLFFSISPDKQPDFVRMHVQVKDNGIGMSRDFLSRVFTPFEREEKSTVNKIQGTGLGMAITKNLVELMDGHITVDSELNKGSCFTIDIPFKVVDEEENIYIKYLAGKHILLLDSDEKRLAMVKQMLESLRMEADCAKNADMAVGFLNDAAFSSLEYFAFLTVEKIPDMEMMMFLPEIRKRMGSHFPILMLSESDWSQTEYMFTKAGVDAFLPMPLFKSRLAAGLYAFMEGGQAEETSESCQDFSKKRLLLAEDIPLNQEIALELLGASGIAIEVANNGQEAVDLFRSSSLFYYDIILMDIQMPIMNGLEATRQIRGLDREDAKQVPIIAMTANAFVEDVKNSLDAGMNAHISKPLDMERVFSTMELFLKENHK